MDILPTNAAHWHLVLNHLPVIGSLAALLLVAWSLIKHSVESKRIALTALVLVGLSAIPAFLTGEPSERHLKGLPGISSRWMSNHEDMAAIALWAAVALGAVALAAWFWFRQTRVQPRWFTALLLVGCVVVWVLMARTANSGGKIHHPEIRPPSKSETPAAGVEF
jgi:multidrug transporter EmrE-like cation transporter